jgi:hypothetical protein
MPDGEHAFGDLTIVEDGGYEHPWPRIYLADYANVYCSPLRQWPLEQSTLWLTAKEVSRPIGSHYV